VPFLAAALCGALTVTADAAPKKKKPQAAPAVVAAPVPPAQGCKSGGGTNADGTCVTRSQWPLLWSGINLNNASVQTRMNYNWAANSPAPGSAQAPVAKDIAVYDQGTRGVASHGAPSDYRFKRDVTPVALLADGAVLYSFRYFGSDKVYVGVMAQQIGAIDPQAVIMHANGYYWVDYDRLGLKMQTLQEWRAGGGSEQLTISQ
jgi:hypothetical protein